MTNKADAQAATLGCGLVLVFWTALFGAGLFALWAVIRVAKIAWEG